MIAISTRIVYEFDNNVEKDDTCTISNLVPSRYQTKSYTYGLKLTDSLSRLT